MLAYGINTFGNWITVVAALAVATFKWQASPIALGGLIAIFLVPAALLSPLAGWLADRLDKRVLLVVANLLGAGIVLGMLCVQSLWQAYLILITLKAVTAVNHPAMVAMVPTLVRPQQIMVANAVLLQPAHITRALSPLLAGVLVGTIGASAAFTLDALTFALASIVVWSIPAGSPGPILGTEEAPAPSVTIGGRNPSSASNSTPPLTSIAGGLLSPRLLVLVVLAVTGAFAFGALESLTPLYIRDLLNGQPFLYGATVSSLGLGSIIGALIAGQLCQSLDRLRTVALGSLVIGLALVLMAAVHSEGSLLAGMALAGSGAGIALAGGLSLAQEESLPHMRGTILGSLWGVSNSATVAGIFLTAGVVALAGVTLSIWAVSLLLIAAVFMAWRFESRLRLGSA